MDNEHTKVFKGGNVGFSFLAIDILSEKVGINEVVFRYIIALLCGFPFGFIYLSLPKHTETKYKHLYFTATGLLINYFCFGPECLYNIFSILVTYISLQRFGGHINNVIFTLIFHTAYLTIGYIKNASDGYDVKWTTPQCILCLRLIGLTWNVYDGAQKEETLSPDQLKTCVRYKPSFLEVFGFSYCFCGVLSGLQYSFRRYHSFIEGTLIDESHKGKTTARFIESLRRFIGACLVLCAFTLLDPYYRCNDLLKSSFLEKPFAMRVLQMAQIYYVQYSKYVIVWWFSESVCIVVGLSYNGADENGNVKWDGLCNFKMRFFLFGAFFQDIIDGFNMLTNRWAGRYIFRRLRFLGNKTASHVFTLLYLAVWHGFYIGYFIMFALEFILVTVERQYRDVLYSIFKTSLSDLPLYAKIPVQVLGAFYKFIACGFCAQAFLLLRWKKIKVVYAATYYWPLIGIATWCCVINPLITTVLKENRKLDKVKKTE